MQILTLDAFADKTLVVCPECKKKATVTSSQYPESAELSCSFCHYYSNKPVPFKKGI